MSKCSENIFPLLKEPNESLAFNMDSDILELEMNILSLFSQHLSGNEMLVFGIKFLPAYIH